MLKYLTPLDWILWALITLVQVELFRVSKGLLKFFRITMGYLLIQSVFQFGTMLLNYSYRTVYYISTILECLLLAGLSIEFGTILVPQFQKIIKRIGPIVIAIPTFIIYAIISFNEVGTDNFIIKSIRISEVAFILSLALLFICLAFESNPIKNVKDISKSYSFLLTLLVICTEFQLRNGITYLIRIIWPLSWLVGLLGIYVTLLRLRNYYQLSELTKSIEGL